MKPWTLGPKPRSKIAWWTQRARELIRRRAYEIYMERGGEPGHDVKDWLQADFELVTHPSKAAGE